MKLPGCGAKGPNMAFSDHSDILDSAHDYLSERAEIVPMGVSGKANEKELAPVDRRGVYPSIDKAVDDAATPEPAKPMPFGLMLLILLSPGLAIGLGTLVAYLIFAFFDTAGKAVAMILL